MKMTCLRCKRALAEYAATDREIPMVGPLAKHLAECPECARELAWYRAVHHGLQGSLTSELVGEGFADATWARFTAASRPRRSLAAVGMLASAVCAAAIAVTIFLRHLPAPSNVHASSGAGYAKTDRDARRDAGQASGRMGQEKATSGASVAATHSTNSAAEHPLTIRHQPLHSTHNKRMMVRSSQHKTHAVIASTAGNHSSETKSVTWDQMASWYENQGDYQSAAEAYAQAVRADPTDTRVFNAGRTSECAGDVAQAIEYYARFLQQERAQESQPKQEEPSGKGTSLWNENRDSA